VCAFTIDLILRFLFSKTLSQDPLRQNQSNVRISLAQYNNGQPILILTNTNHNAYTVPDFTSPVPTSVCDRHFGYDSGDLGDRKSIYGNLEELPEDLEGIDVDPSVCCDVKAVIQYEQDLGRKVPKLETIAEMK